MGRKTKRKPDSAKAGKPGEAPRPAAPAPGPRWWRYLTRESLLIPLLLLFLVTVVLVNPRGDFPLNDDWLFAKSVQTLLKEHRLVRHPFAAPSAAPQILWGALAAALFGFSFTALRATTLLVAALGCWAVARCARACGLSRNAALLCGALVLCNPLFVNLSFTFMTDVPFFTLMAFSALFSLRALRSGRARDVCLASAFGGAAFFLRQFGVCAGGAYALAAALVSYQRRQRIPLRHCVAFLAPWLAAGLLFLIWRAAQEPRAPGHDFSAGRSWPFRIALCFSYAAVITTYMGLYVLPAAWARASQLVTRRERWRPAQWAGFGAFTALAASFLLFVHCRPLPVLYNILYDLGTGPLLLRYAQYVYRGWAPVHIGDWWWAITLLAVAAGGVLVADLIHRCRLRPGEPVSDAPPQADGPFAGGQGWFLFFWAALVTASSYNPFVSCAFDRYTLPVLIPAAVLCAGGLTPRLPKAGKALLGLTLALFYLFSVAAAHDYLAWNRARWAGLDYLRNEVGAPPERIDGGYEFNGMYTSDTFMELHDTRDFYERGDKEWWVLDDTYAVSFFLREDYEEIARMPYFAWLGMERRYIFVLKRPGAPARL
ncbi:MAG: glycosyltransferase family 39 protein [Candidatus Hydrogenedentes bacterium]|nr:glycosyltransferase family 39 protein [Candidatus Hydrogenedentota bacterium]